MEQNVYIVPGVHKGKENVRIAVIIISGVTNICLNIIIIVPRGLSAFINSDCYCLL